MTDIRERLRDSLTTTPGVSTRREWELQERVRELERDLAERVERERIRELELSAQRHELEVRFAYNASLEQRARDQQERIEWLQSHLESEVGRLAEEHRRVAEQAAADRAQAAEELAFERERVAEHQRAVEWFKFERDEYGRELEAERRRVSYRVTQRIANWVHRHRIVRALLRRASRVLTG